MRVPPMRLLRTLQRRGSVGALAIGALALVVAACGGSDDTDTPTLAESPRAPSDDGATDRVTDATDPEVQAALAGLRDDSGMLDAERHTTVSQIVADLDLQIPARDPFLPELAVWTPAGEVILRDDNRPHLFGFDWLTNFGIRIVRFEEFDPRVERDGIIPIKEPTFIDVAEAIDVYEVGSPVVHVEINGDVRAYPLAILIWHEVINDVVGGVPVLVTYCPLCNTAIAFDRRLGDATLTFGTSGLVRNSDLVMYDNQTESVWQQVGGKALIGDLVGATLTPIPSPIVSFGQFRTAFPEALVMDFPDLFVGATDLAGFTPRIPYGNNPYVLYDDLAAENDPRRLYQDDVDERLHFAARVVGLRIEDEAIAYPFALLEEQRVIEDEVGGVPVVVFWAPGARSALDTGVIDAGREVGSAGVFERTLDGADLVFSPNPDDPQTFLDSGGSVWDIFGRAIAGPREGARLTPLVHGTHLWFAWSVFEPETAVAE